MAEYVDNVLKPLADVKSRAAPGKLLETIRENETVKNAHDAFIQSLDPIWTQQASHGLAVQLLNCISAAYYEHVLPDGDALIFTKHSKPPTGDYLALDIKPEICGFLGPLATLLLARQHQNYKSHQAWSTLVEVGELERREGETISWDRLGSYVVGLKRYKPDMTTVHGLTLANGLARLCTLNAAGVLWSDRTPWTDLSPWIAHVVEVYNSLRGRVFDMQYCAAQDGFPRWDIRKAGVGLAVTPFEVGSAPGRTTFACFEVGRLPVDGPGTDPQLLADFRERFDSGVVNGFWKFSWQETDSKTTEAELLSYVHRNGWVPGLVRHYTETTVRGDHVSAIRPPSGEGDFSFVRDILHLGSIGQPLSQCETAGDLLDVMYDLIETHAHVCELGVLHRDVSYFNVMCKPKHYITTHPVLKNGCVLERPCIKKIFGDKNGQSCVLLADLDHATTFAELAKEPIDPEKFVGTHMFKSLYLCDPGSKWRFRRVELDSLLSALEEAENKEPDIYRRAFPAGDNDFMAKFKQVVDAERLRDHRKVPSLTVPLTQQDWWHDAESIYWVFLYAFGRALPLGCSELESWAFLDICQAMLTTTPTGSEWRREKWIRPSCQNALFTEELERMGELFETMASYMAIPWHLYCGDGGIMAGNRDHVHVALRRIILSFKIQPENADVLRVGFDTAAPRVTSAFEPLYGEDDTYPDEWPVPPAPMSEDTQFSTAQKRMAEEQAFAIMHGNAPPLSEGGTTAVVNDARPSTSPADSCASTVVAHDQAQVPVARKRKVHSSEDDDGGSDTRCLKRSKMGGQDPSDASNDIDTTMLQPELDASQKRAMTVPPTNDEVAVVESEGTATDGNMGSDSDDELDGNADDKPNSKTDKPNDKAQDRYDASLHLQSRSAKALRLMVLKDRALWFGSGKWPSSKRLSSPYSSP